jgi:hypothetical protein
MLDVLGIKDAQKLIPMEEDQKPMDPVSENQNVLMMKPVKAFAYQDHQAHITVHMSAMQDPKIMALLQNNPMAQQLQAAMMAHINEHLGFEYRKQIEMQLGMSLPPQKDESGEDIHMNPEVEARLAPMLAMASQRLLQNNQAEVAQQQAQQLAQDPMVQMQQAELQIKSGELERKKQKDAVDAQLKQAQLQIEKERVDNQAQIEGVKIGTKAEQDRLRFASEQTTKGIEIGLAAENDKRKASIQREQIYTQAQTQRENVRRQQSKPTKGE